MLSNVQLHSDFWDIYDHHFCGSWVSRPDAVLHRQTCSGMARPAMLRYLESTLDLVVPRHGRVRHLVPRLLSDWHASLRPDVARHINVVVYTDEQAHAGNGKLRMSADLALSDYPDAYASAFISGPGGLRIGTSLRYLNVGGHHFWLRYQSRDDWRSNCGDVTIRLLDDQTVLARIPELSLWAIDFVVADQLYAVDFNRAPKIGGTGVDALLSPKAIYDSIVSGLPAAARHNHSAALN